MVTSGIPPVDLAALLRQEHANVLSGAWGFFFPVVLAVWRYLNSVSAEALGEVHAVWTDTEAAVPTEIEVRGEKFVVTHRQELSFDPDEGPLFFGSGGTWLVGELEEGPFVEAVEAVAYDMLNRVPKGRLAEGPLSLREVPEADEALVDRLASTARRRFAERAASG